MLDLFRNEKLEILGPEYSNESVKSIIKSMMPFDWTNDYSINNELLMPTLVMRNLKDMGDGVLYEGQWDSDLNVPYGRGI